MIIYKDVDPGDECPSIALVGDSELPIFRRVLTTLDPTMCDYDLPEHIGLKSHEVEFMVNSGLFEIEFRNDYSYKDIESILHKMNHEDNIE